ncbi:DNA-binding transcriptional regulator, MarR family [bacterium A37T11]|nr:DNA-binding transcriptional regulator, MarR family [bacterium A37T11]
MEEEVLKLEQQVCFPIYALSREIIQRYHPFLDTLDITYPQYLVLMVLWEHQKQTVNQLGEKLLLDSGTLTPLLKRLELKGLVLRKRSNIDERVVEISLTEAGSAIESEAGCIPGKLVEALGITGEELAELQYSVNKILNKVKKNKLKQ